MSVEYCTGAQSGAGLSRFARLARGGSLRYGRVAAGAPDRTGDCPRLEAAIRTRENPRQPCDSVAHRPFGLPLAGTDDIGPRNAFAYGYPYIRHEQEHRDLG